MVLAHLLAASPTTKNGKFPRNDTQPHLFADLWQRLTWILWATFPLIELSYNMGLMSFPEQRVCRVLADVFVKTVYSVSILSGNFCLLDTISELRLAQMEESQAETEENFERTEKLNEALKMKCVEADTNERMSKRFVANLSHELRTPLNSVIAFNSLLLEAGLDPLHEDYVKSSLTSAEALLGVIGQVSQCLFVWIFYCVFGYKCELVVCVG
jgi:signal transduction histidine kinase